MRFIVYPAGAFYAWVLRDGVELICKSPPYPDRRAAVEGAREFKRAVAAAEIEADPRPWERQAAG